MAVPGDSRWILDRLDLDEVDLAAYCKRWKVDVLETFGSVTGSSFTDASDVDVLLTFATDATWGLMDLAEMRDQLAVLVRRPVDLLTRRSVEASNNAIRRSSVLDSARKIYVDEGRSLAA